MSSATSSPDFYHSLAHYYKPDQPNDTDLYRKTLLLIAAELAVYFDHPIYWDKESDDPNPHVTLNNNVWLNPHDLNGPISVDERKRVVQIINAAMKNGNLPDAHDAIALQPSMKMEMLTVQEDTQVIDYEQLLARVNTLDPLTEEETEQAIRVLLNPRNDLNEQERMLIEFYLATLDLTSLDHSLEYPLRDTRKIAELMGHIENTTAYERLRLIHLLKHDQLTPEQRANKNVDDYERHIKLQMAMTLAMVGFIYASTALDTFKLSKLKTSDNEPIPDNRVDQSTVNADAARSEMRKFFESYLMPYIIACAPVGLIKDKNYEFIINLPSRGIGLILNLPASTWISFAQSWQTGIRGLYAEANRQLIDDVINYEHLTEEDILFIQSWIRDGYPFETIYPMIRSLMYHEGNTLPEQWEILAPLDIFSLQPAESEAIFGQSIKHYILRMALEIPLNPKHTQEELAQFVRFARRYGYHFSWIKPYGIDYGADIDMSQQAYASLAEEYVRTLESRYMAELGPFRPMLNRLRSMVRRDKRKKIPSQAIRVQENQEPSTLL